MLVSMLATVLLATAIVIILDDNAAFAQILAPSPPTNIQGTADDGQVVLSWTAPSNDISDYIIYYRNIPFGERFHTFNDGTSDSTSATVTGLTNGERYVFKVQAVSDMGRSEVSSDRAFAVPVPSSAVMPSPPTNIQGTADDGQVVLSWTAPSNDISYYIIYYRNIPFGERFHTFNDGTSDSTSATVTGLTNGERYVFKVQAVSNMGRSEVSSDRAFAVPVPSSAVMPSPPTNIQGTADDGQVVLSWTAPSNDISYYIIYYRNIPFGERFHTFNDGTSDSTSATVTGLTNGERYVFKVQAVSNMGRSEVSSDRAFAVPVPSSAVMPSPPTNIQGTADDGQVVLSWTAPSNDISYYIIYYRNIPFGERFHTFNDGTSDSTSATVTGLTNGERYVFKVQAVSNMGRSEVSSDRAFAVPVPSSAVMPSPPTNIQGTADDGQVVLSWTAPSNDISYYIIYYRNIPFGERFHTFNDGTSDSTSATVTGLTNGERYVFKVQAVSNMGRSEVSSDRAFAVPVPSAPTDSTPPTFDVSGNTTDYTTNVELGGTYAPGVIQNIVDASDTDGGVISGDTVNVNATGTYSVTYTVTDNSPAANFAAITETVIVGDTTPPTDSTPPRFTFALFDTRANPLALHFDELIDVSNVDTSKMSISNATTSFDVSLDGADVISTTDSDTVYINMTSAQLSLIDSFETLYLIISPDAVQDISGNGISIHIDGSSLKYETRQTANIGNIPEDVAFNNDGTKMFVLERGNTNLKEFSLTTAFDVSSANFDSSRPLPQIITPSSLVFNNDGSKMFVVSTNSHPDRVYEYLLSTPFDISTVSFTTGNQYSVDRAVSNPGGLAFNNDGSKMFVASQSDAGIYEYALSTEFSVRTASFTGSHTLSGDSINAIYDIEFSDDGTILYTVDPSSDRVRIYLLSTPFDVSTATYSESLDVSSNSRESYGFAIIDDIFKVFIADNFSNDIDQYSAIRSYVILESPDTTAPVITVAPSEIIITLNSATPDLLLGVTTDDGSAVTVSGTVDTGAIGDYTITYSSVDASGNPAAVATRTYRVVESVPPITLVVTQALNTPPGMDTLTFTWNECLDPRTHEWYIYHTHPADSRESIRTGLVSGLTLLPSTQITGTLMPRTGLVIGLFTAVAYDADLFASPTLNRLNLDNVVCMSEAVTPIIIEDNAVPVITLTGDNPLQLTVGESYTDPGYSAYDNPDGNITSSVVIAGDTVDTTTPGSHSVTYDVTDAAGNNAVQVIRIVNVILRDSTPPTFDVSGNTTDYTTNVELGGTYAPGVIQNIVDASDTDGGVISGDTVNVNATGTYSVTYTVTDNSPAANFAAITETVIVGDTTPPTFDVSGNTTDYTTNVELGGTYAPGVIQNIVDASDTDGGVISGDTVNVNATGTYSVTYTVTDNSPAANFAAITETVIVA